MKTPPTNSICSVDPAIAQVIELPSHLPICQMLWPTDERTEKETFANAEFIAEAFTVFHETGLTPREILAQRDDLLGVLDNIRECMNQDDPESYVSDDREGAICYAHQCAVTGIEANQNATTKGDTPA